MPELTLSNNLAGMRNALIKIVTQELEDLGDFDPVALVKNSDGEVTILESLGRIADEVPKGLRANQLRRYVEDSIRAIQKTQDIDSVAMLSDGILRPQEGGPGTMAMLGFFEERPGPLLLVITEYQLRGGRVHLGQVTISERPGHLLSQHPPER
jgi:hypothetical protein